MLFCFVVAVVVIVIVVDEILPNTGNSTAPGLIPLLIAMNLNNLKKCKKEALPSVRRWKKQEKNTK